MKIAKIKAQRAAFYQITTVPNSQYGYSWSLHFGIIKRNNPKTHYNIYDIAILPIKCKAI